MTDINGEQFTRKGEPALFWRWTQDHFGLAPYFLVCFWVYGRSGAPLDSNKLEDWVSFMRETRASDEVMECLYESHRHWLKERENEMGSTRTAIL